MTTIAFREASKAKTSISVYTLWMVSVGLALSMAVNSLFNAEETRTLPYVLMLSWMALTLWHVLGWYLAPDNRRSMTSLHVAALALAVYLPVSAPSRSEVYVVDSSIEIGRFYLWILAYFFFFAAAKSNVVSEGAIKIVLLITLPAFLFVVFHGRAG